MKSIHVTTTRALIVGAGPAGIGVGIALKKAGVDDFLIVEARKVGAAFHGWTKGMSMLTPSFYSNPFGQTDLNAIEPDSSLAEQTHCTLTKLHGYLTEHTDLDLSYHTLHRYIK